MDQKRTFLIIILTLVLAAGFPITGRAEGLSPQQVGIHPENTLFLANQMDARFSQDFSTLLKHSRLDWIILDSAVVPESARDQNLILLGNLDAPYSGEVIRELVSSDQIELLQADQEGGIILEIESPWNEDRSVIICSGGDSIGIRDAGERAFRALIDASPPTSDWIRTTYEAPLDDDLDSLLDQLRYSWTDNEISVQTLRMDIQAKPLNRISTGEAVEDVERLFYLFSHGYAGFGFFNQNGEFEQAKSAILEALSEQSSWSTNAFTDLLYSHLDFIKDCHLNIGGHNFSEHSDFWYDTNYELSLEKGGYQFLSKGTLYTVVSINGVDPEPFIFPSLNKEGSPIYRLGTLSTEKPQPLLLLGLSEEQEHSFEIKLKRSDFNYYSENIFQEDLLGGIPVIRVRSFGDYYQDTLLDFTQTATRYRGDPVVIVDIRGNGGGNESWPISWIQRLSGRRAEAIFVYSQLESKTSLMGRANSFDYWIQTADIESYRSDLQTYLSAADAIENGNRQARWTGPIYPQLPLIPNDTTVIMITNDLVASAGEGLVMRSSQLENVLVVGENTMGCLTFGNISAHKLPHSNLFIWMPINFGLFPDQEIREGVGLAPDLWVPAADAVNYTVAALRKGTITTALPIPGEILDAEFKPESGWGKTLDALLEFWPIITIFAVGTAVWGFFFRKNTAILMLVGSCWCLLGLYLILTNNPKSGQYGLIAGGVVSLIWGTISLVTKKRKRLDKSE